MLNRCISNCSNSDIYWDTRHGHMGPTLSLLISAILHSFRIAFSRPSLVAMGPAAVSTHHSHLSRSMAESVAELAVTLTLTRCAPVAAVFFFPPTTSFRSF